MKLWRTNRGLTREDVEETPGSPASPLIAPEVHALLYYASLAPSGHNAQPWRVRVGAGELWIGTDRARWLPKVDPTNREAALSVGAFVENLIVAAPTYGYVAEYQVIGTSSATEMVRVH